MAFRDDISRYGLVRAVGARVFRRLQRHCGLHLWSVQTRPILETYDIPPEHAVQFSFRRLTLEDALAASENPELAMTAAFVRAAFHRGDICVGAYEGGELVAYTWRALVAAPVKDAVWLRLLGNSRRYGYKAMVLPRHRGNRLSVSVGRFWDRNFLDMGVTQDIGYVDLHNLASMKSTFRDPSRKRIGYAGFVQVGKRVRTFRTPAVQACLAFETDRQP